MRSSTAEKGPGESGSGPKPLLSGIALPLAAAAVLLALGAGIFLIARAIQTQPDLRMSGSVAPLNEGALDALDIRAHNSPAIAKNPVIPSNLIVANRVDTPSFSCAVHFSLDGGRRWRETKVPLPAAEEPKCFGPDVAMDRAGTIYLSYVTLKGVANIPSGIWISTSANGGRTFSPPVRAYGPNAFQVRLASDPGERGRLYLAWVEVNEVSTFGFVKPGNPIHFARSDDGGSSWQGPERISHPSRQRSVAPSIAVGPRGEVYVAYLDVKEDSLDYHGEHGGRGGPPHEKHWELVLARSFDLGSSWSHTVLGPLVPTQRFLVFFPPHPSVAVDRESGNVYVAFQDGRSGDSDVLLWSSPDTGRSFGRPLRVNDNRMRDRTSQYLPKVGVADGVRVDVLYYDRRSDKENVKNEVSLQSSFDGAATFTPRLRVSDRPFDSSVGFGSERGMPELGSRLGLVSTDAGALAVWADTRAGTHTSNKQDLAMAVVQISPSSTMSFLRLPLQGLATLITASTLVIAALAIRTRLRAAESAGKQASRGQSQRQ